ncbi:peptidase dimerization domain-containing protein [Lederbergia graminis]|uniref:Peptidase dimerization domain-containing protein n=1 Tax=Lederbergia graminis TaxID=735518 RepID=A0ABW0LKM2_9BACI
MERFEEKIIHALQDFEREYAIRKRHPFLPPPTFNFGAIKGGMAGIIVPDYCMLDFGLHFLPEDGYEDGLGSLVDTLYLK